MASGDVGEISLRDNCLQARHFGSNLQVSSASGSGTGIPLGSYAALSIANADLAIALPKYVDVTLTAAQVKALNTTPIALVAAPGLALAVLVESIYVSMVYVSATYSCNASGASLFYTDGSGTAVGITVTQAFIQLSSGTNHLFIRGSATALAPVANAAIVIKAATSDPTTGDSLIKIRTHYRVVTAPLT